MKRGEKRKAEKKTVKAEMKGNNKKEDDGKLKRDTEMTFKIHQKKAYKF